MKKNKVFITSFLYASVFCLVWLAGVIGFTALFQVKVDRSLPVKREEETGAPIPVPIRTGFSVLAVISGEEEPEIGSSSRELRHLFLCYTDFLTDKMTFIETPTNTKTELSAASLELLSAYQPKMPSFLMVSELYRLFPGQKFCMAAEELFSGVVGIRPKAAYVITEELFSLFSKTEKGKTSFIPPADARKLLLSIHRNGISDRSETEDFIYLESYRDIKDINSIMLPGKAEVQAYVPDMKTIRELAEELASGRR